MKKAILFIACFVFLVLTLSAFTDRGTAPGIGYRAPELALGNDSTTAPVLDRFKGEYVLVTFWSSSDAASRIRCNEYTAIAGQKNTVNHLAVNFDPSEQLYREIVKLDNLAASRQYHVEGPAAGEIMENYHLDRGLHSFLINPDGIITAIDPDKEFVKSLL